VSLIGDVVFLGCAWLGKAKAFWPGPSFGSRQMVEYTWAPCARLLLAVAALRDGNRTRDRDLLCWLASHYLILALDEALTTFSQVAPRQSKVVELRYFGGLTEEEIVAALKISPRTVRRDWDLAKAWLLRDLNPKIRKPSVPPP